MDKKLGYRKSSEFATNVAYGEARANVQGGPKMAPFFVRLNFIKAKICFLKHLLT